MSHMNERSRRSAGRALRLVVAMAAVLFSNGCMSPAEEADAYYESGMQLLEQGELAKARLEFKNALQIKSDMADAMYGLVLVAEQESDWQAMLTLLAGVIERDPMHRQARFKRGRLLLAAGELDKARETSETALQLNPEGAEELALQAAVRYRGGDAAGAREVAESALEREPGNADALVVVATALMADGRAAEAVERLDAGLRSDPRNLALALMKVNALEQLGRLEAAERTFREVLAAHPENRSLHHLLADFYLRHGLKDKAHDAYRARMTEPGGEVEEQLDYLRFVFSAEGMEAALAQARELAGKNPENSELQFALSELLRARGDPEAAGEVLAGVVRGRTLDSPEGVRASGLLAGLNLASGNTEEATRLVDDILAVDENDQEALFLRAFMAVRDGELDRAIADLRTILRDAPDSARTHGLLARAYELQGAHALAVDHYVAAFRESGFAAPHGLRYAQFLLQQDDAARAETVLSDVLAASPGDATALAATAELLSSEGVDGEAQPPSLGGTRAIRYFRTAIRDDPQNLDGYRGLVRAYVKAKRYSDADQALSSGLQVAPRDVELRYMRASLRELTGKFEEAIALYEELVKERPEAEVMANNLASLLAEHRTDAASLERAYALAQPLAGRDVPQFQDTVGWIHHKRGEHRRAAELLARAAARLPDAPVVRYHLGMNHLALADEDAARAELRKALELAATATESFPYADAARDALSRL